MPHRPSGLVFCQATDNVRGVLTRNWLRQEEDDVMTEFVHRTRQSVTRLTETATDEWRKLPTQPNKHSMERFNLPDEDWRPLQTVRGPARRRKGIDPARSEAKVEGCQAPSRTR